MTNAVDHVLQKGAARVTGINDTTRDKIKEALTRGIGDGMTVLEVADLIENGGMVGGLDMSSLFDESRAELVARTEMMSAYNAAALGSYADAGVEKVQAIDGDGDEECAARDGEIFDLDEADTIEDHPNGTLDWVPVTWEPAEVPEEEQPEPIEFPEAPVSGDALEQTARDLVEKATRAEPTVTRDLLAIGEQTNLDLNAAFRLEGRKFNTLAARLKTEGSTLRKVQTEAQINKTANVREIAESMKDNLRYTYIAEPDSEAFAASVRETVDEMIARGYEPLRATNYFAHEEGYAGLNTNWRTASGQLFEVQFHTQAGLETKEVLSHPLYEALRILPADSAEARAIDEQVADLWREWRARNPDLGQNLGFLRDTFPVVR